MELKQLDRPLDPKAAEAVS